MGMLATIINSLALRSALEDNGVKARVLTLDPDGTHRRSITPAKALGITLEASYVVIIGGGTSNPYFSTDSASAARHRDRSRRHAQGHARGRRLYGRSGRKTPPREVHEITPSMKFIAAT